MGHRRTTPPKTETQSKQAPAAKEKGQKREIPGILNTIESKAEGINKKLGIAAGIIFTCNEIYTFYTEHRLLTARVLVIVICWIVLQIACEAKKGKLRYLYCAA